MGTSIRLVAALPAGSAAARHSDANARLDAAADWLCEVDRTLSRFRPGSELSRLNAAAGHPCLVSRMLIDVLHTALAAAHETDGLCDPTILPCLRAAGYTASLPDLMAGPVPDAGEAVGWAPGYRQVLINERMRLVTLPPGCTLDFGGIAKGWAADTVCSSWPSDLPLAVDVGGDVRVRPGPGQSGWPVTVADPLQPDRDLARLTLPSCGVATSSSAGRRWLTRQGWRHHIIDPRSGYPAQSDLAQATVVAPTAAAAEACAKAVCILGSEAGAAFLARRPDTAALMIRHDRTCLATPNLEVYLDAFPGGKVSA